MGYLEDNLLKDDSFSNAICNLEKYEEPRAGEDSSISTKPFGMFDMESDYDIVKGKYSARFFKVLSDNGGAEIIKTKEKSKRLGDRYKFEVACDT